ncbi:sulfatase-like hydrolase/transferase [Pelobium sp.]|nr:sulfatase-like hydrolase/transferase [Pelobium sp.]MDA9555466.1 sulfatase-like hydrolase/transferase [Pelobium sp.]
MIKRIIFFSLFGVFVTTFNTVMASTNPPAKPNVVIIIVDDLGSGDVSFLFRKTLQTPNIDRFAKEGVKFESGYVPVPLCGPSRAAILTGRYPQTFGFGDNKGGIPAAMPIISGVLKNAGYYTAHIGKWHSDGPMPYLRNAFDETLCSPTSSPFINYHHPTLARNGKVETSDEYSTDLFAREATEFIERNKNRPFQLTVAFNAPHILKVVKNATLIKNEYDKAVAEGKVYQVPMTKTSRLADRNQFNLKFPTDSSRADIAATIFALDQAVGRILDKLKATKLDKNTIVFFIGDNGGHPENRSENLPLRDYKWSTYEGGIRVPFFAMYPGVFPAGLNYKKPVSSLDIFKTCMALTKTKEPENLDGVNLTPFLTGKLINAPHDALYFKYRDMGAVRSDKWKLIIQANKPSELYDLSTDLEEKNNVATANSDLVEKLYAKWQSWLASTKQL